MTANNVMVTTSGTTRPQVMSWRGEAATTTSTTRAEPTAQIHAALWDRRRAMSGTESHVHMIAIAVEVARYRTP